MPRFFTYVLEASDSVAAYALETVASVLGVLGLRRDPVAGAAADVWYGNHPPEGFGGIVVPVNADDVFWPELLADEIEATMVGPRLPFDLVGAIGRLLTDQPHGAVRAEDLDPHGRLRFAASEPTHHGWGGVPVADRYIRLLGSMLGSRGISGLPMWPDGRVAAIGLSHDVDEPDRYALLGQALRPWRLRRAPRTYLRTVRGQIASRRRLHGRDDYWLFDEVIGAEASLGFRSTFFFAVTPFHDRWGAPEDVAYDIGGRRLRTAFARLREVDFDIGLHAGYRAHESPARFVEERRRLEAAAHVDVVGLRHHYWHLGSDPDATLGMHEEAGFRYDSSLAFNDHVGFRRSTALPYWPYDRKRARSITTLQLPAVCMDGNLFYGSDDVEGNVRAVGELVDTITSVGGFGSIDWHIQASYPGNAEFRSWGVGYQEILRLLTGRPDLWVTDLRSVERWVSERETRRRDPTAIAEVPAPL